MNLLRASIVTALAMSATIASAQGVSPSIEERLRQLESEQAAMKQQLAERDAVIEELKRELQAQGAVAVLAPTPAAEAPGAAPAAQAPVVAASATEPQGRADRSRRARPRRGRSRPGASTTRVTDSWSGGMITANFRSAPTRWLDT